MEWKWGEQRGWGEGRLPPLDCERAGGRRKRAVLGTSVDDSVAETEVAGSSRKCLCLDSF